MPLLTEMTLQWPEHPSALLDSGPQSAQGHHGALAMHFSSLEAQFPHLEVEEAKRDDLKGRSQLYIARAATWGNRSSSESNPSMSSRSLPGFPGAYSASARPAQQCTHRRAIAGSPCPSPLPCGCLLEGKTELRASLAMPCSVCPTQPSQHSPREQS